MAISGREMKYTVTWTPSARNELCRIWIDAVDRQAVTSAANEFDAALRTDPNTVGESRGDGVRILTVAPLSIYYRVSEADRCVEVWSVWISSPVG
jgi:plasmid stabilization system protein ParE